jgi:hypothetical protein
MHDSYVMLWVPLCVGADAMINAEISGAIAMGMACSDSQQAKGVCHSFLFEAPHSDCDSEY